MKRQVFLALEISGTPIACPYYDARFHSNKENPMQPEKLPQLALAQALVSAAEEILEIDEQDKRTLISRFTDMLRPVCKATEEAYQRGFDDGYQLRSPNAIG